MDENHVKKVSELFQSTNNIEIINKYFEENNLTFPDRITIIKEALSINTNDALEIVTKKYKGELSDKLLDLFLNCDEEESNM